MTIVSIHQPGYLPWLGFFKKISSCDTFVFLDDAQYVKRQWHNRNMIRTSQGSMWLSVPTKSKTDSNLNEVKIDYSTSWSLTHKKSIKYNYSKAVYFEKYWDFIEGLYKKKFDLLLDLNVEIIRFIIKELGITTRTIFSSELEIKEKGSDRNLSICKALGADTYLSGILGKNYLIVDDFAKNNIAVQFQNFQHPVYRQCYDPFIPNMAAIDILFNEGEKSIEILRNAKNF